MARYFTHYWNKESVEEAKCLAEEGYDDLDHVASNRFRTRGVRPGDHVYAVHISRGEMGVLGRMRVAEIVGYDDAVRRLRLKYEPWAADDHLFAEEGTATLLDFTRKVKPSVAKSLRFLTSSGEKRSLVFSKVNPDKLDSQTLRGVRRLTEESAGLLDELIPE